MPENLPECGVVKMLWNHRAKVGSTEGVFDFARKVYDWGARVREVTISVRVLDADEAAEWRAFFLRLDGEVNTFNLTPYGGEKPRGSVWLPVGESGRWEGEPQVDGAGQIGKTLAVSGLPPNKSDALKAGDWFSLGGTLHEAVADVASDAFGKGSIGLWRALGTAPASGALLGVDSPVGEFRLLGGIPAQAWTVSQLSEGLQFKAREVLL